MRALKKRSIYNRLRAFTIIEITVVISVILILGAIGLSRVGNAREKALQARASADARELQLAYDRALNYRLPILTNESIPTFATNAFDSALINQVPNPESQSRITLANGSFITNGTAQFIVGTNGVAANYGNNGNGTNGPNTNAVAGDTYPLVKVTGPVANGIYHSGERITLAATATANVTISQVEFFYDGVSVGAAAAAPYSTPYTLTAGTHVIKAVASSTGGPGQAEITINVIASTPPNVALTSTPAGGSYFVSTPISLDANASATDTPGSITKLEIYEGSNLKQSANAASVSYPWLSSVPGTYSFTAKAYDSYNNTKVSDPILFTLKDYTPPTVAFTTPVDGASYGFTTPVEFSASASGNDGSIIMKITLKEDDSAVTSTNINTLLYTNTPAIGTHVYVVEAMDNHGKLNTAVKTITMVNNPPVVAGPNMDSTLIAGITNYITGTITDEQSAKAYIKVNGTTIWTNNAINGAFSVPWSPSTAGTYTITAEATDAKGLSITTSQTAVVAANRAPIATLVAPANGSQWTEDSVPLNVTASDPDGEAISNVSIYVDNALFAQANSSSLSFLTNMMVGTHAVYATASNPNGIGYSTTNSVQVKANGNTVLLFQMEGANNSKVITDTSTYAHTVTKNNASSIISTAVAKSGKSSYYNSDAVGGGFTVASAPELEVFQGDYTVEMWVYPNTTSSTWDMVFCKPTGPGMSPIRIDIVGGTGAYYRFLGSEDGSAWNQNVAMGSVDLNQWTHLAVCRSGNKIYLWKNGVNTATATTSSATVGWNNGLAYEIGNMYNNGNHSLVGYMDDIRVTKGKALYTP